MRTLLVFFIFICVLNTAFAQNTENPVDYQTQIHNDFLKAQNDLDSLYQAILKKYSNNTILVEHLKSSQKAWETYKDAQLKAKYSYEENANPVHEYGTMYLSCYPKYATILIRKRIKELQPWLYGIEEGDVCAGSVGRE